MASCSTNRTQNNGRQTACSCLDISNVIKKCIISHGDNHVRSEGYCTKLDTPIIFRGISPKTYNDTVITVKFVRVDKWIFFDSLANKTRVKLYYRTDKINCSVEPVPNLD